MIPDKFMPRWYTLQVIASSDGNCIDIANMIHESGDFSSACPSFDMDISISYDPKVSQQ